MVPTVRCFFWRLGTYYVYVPSTRDVPSGLTANETADSRAPFVLRRLREHRGKQSERADGGLPFNKPIFRPGQTVLIRQPRQLFRKVDRPQFYSTLYRVTKVKAAEPRSRYILETAAGDKVTSGSFSESQLAPVRPLAPTSVSVSPSVRLRPTSSVQPAVRPTTRPPSPAVTRSRSTALFERVVDDTRRRTRGAPPR